MTETMMPLIYFTAGLFTGLLIMFLFLSRLRKEQSILKRQYEKTSVNADDSELKIRTLENKIKTLEAALEKSLKDKQ